MKKLTRAQVRAARIKAASQPPRKLLKLALPNRCQLEVHGKAFVSERNHQRSGVVVLTFTEDPIGEMPFELRAKQAVKLADVLLTYAANLETLER
jgi:hypothetical protein